MNNEMLLLFLSCFVSACFGALAMLTVVLFFVERREKKREQQNAAWIEQRCEALRAEIAGDSPTWTPNGNE